MFMYPLLGDQERCSNPGDTTIDAMPGQLNDGNPRLVHGLPSPIAAADISSDHRCRSTNTRLIHKTQDESETNTKVDH